MIQEPKFLGTVDFNVKRVASEPKFDPTATAGNPKAKRDILSTTDLRSLERRIVTEFSGLAAGSSLGAHYADYIRPERTAAIEGSAGVNWHMMAGSWRNEFGSTVEIKHDKPKGEEESASIRVIRTVADKRTKVSCSVEQNATKERRECFEMLPYPDGDSGRLSGNNGIRLIVSDKMVSFEFYDELGGIRKSPASWDIKAFLASLQKRFDWVKPDELVDGSTDLEHWKDFIDTIKSIALTGNEPTKQADSGQKDDGIPF